MGGRLFSFPPDKRISRERRRQRLEAARVKATHTQLEWLVLQGIFGNRCVKCGASGTVKDHIKPLYRDGSDGIDNLQPLCGFCNTGKGPEAIDYRAKTYPRWRDHFDEVIFSISERWP